MRAVIVGLAGLLIAGDAYAADYLRGSNYDAPPAAGYNWSGVYVGGQVGTSSSRYQFGDSTRPLVANILRQTLIENEANVSEWVNMPSAKSRSTSWGAFAGYNSQWGDVVMGFELNYNRLSGSTASSSDTIGRIYEATDEYRYNVIVSSDATARLTDLGSARLRLGYAWGWIMPYGMVGLAVGRVDAFRTATVDLSATDASAQGRPPLADVQTQSDSRSGALSYGYVVGAGVDIGLFPGVFVRGEWEFAQLAGVLGVPIRLNSFRVGAGVKF